MRLPPWIVFQVLGYMFGKQDVTSIAAIHHPLREIDSGAGDIRLCIEISDLVNWAAVDSHSNVQLGMTFQRFCNFQSAKDWCLETVAKDKRAAVTSRQTQQFAFRFR